MTEVVTLKPDIKGKILFKYKYLSPLILTHPATTRRWAFRSGYLQYESLRRADNSGHRAARAALLCRIFRNFGGFLVTFRLQALRAVTVGLRVVRILVMAIRLLFQTDHFRPKGFGCQSSPHLSPESSFLGIVGINTLPYRCQASAPPPDSAAPVRAIFRAFGDFDRADGRWPAGRGSGSG